MYNKRNPQPANEDYIERIGSLVRSLSYTLTDQPANSTQPTLELVLKIYFSLKYR